MQVLMQLINKFAVDSKWRIGGLFNLKYLVAMLKKIVSSKKYLSTYLRSV